VVCGLASFVKRLPQFAEKRVPVVVLDLVERPAREAGVVVADLLDYAAYVFLICNSRRHRAGCDLYGVYADGVNYANMRRNVARVGRLRRERALCRTLTHFEV
jgi:hypothetical protein